MSRLPIFVYGTLKERYTNYNRILRGKTKKIIEGEVEGALYSLGGFPGYVKEGKDKVSGELMFIKDDYYNDVLERLDILEGYSGYLDTSGNLYNREIIRVHGPKGKIYRAWIYIWNGRVDEFFRIKNGVWK